MAILGKLIDYKTLRRIRKNLYRWLDKDEEIIGVFKANRWNPPREGFVLTSRRMLIVNNFTLKFGKVVDEIAADDIQEFSFEKGLLRAKKTYVIKKDGTNVYLGMMLKADSLVPNELLLRMSGAPQSIAEKIRAAKKEQKKIIGIFPDKKAQRKAVIQELRESLHEDWKTIVATIVNSLRQHWDTLEVKFEQHIQQDDYGNEYIDNNFDSEIIYFSHKVVLPEIKKLIADGRIKYYSFESIQAPESVKKNLYQIKYSDEDSVIASKYVSGILSETGDGLINDELLYALHKDDGIGFVSVENESNKISSKGGLLTLEFDGSLQPNEPMRVTFISGLVFILFYAMFNSKPLPSRLSQSSPQADFVGNDPYRYEEYTKNILRSNGFKARKTRSSGDFGVDVLASKNGRSYAIQCKLYNRPVGTKAIQEIVSGRMHYRADYALVVSDNKFTEAAKSLARSTNVTLTHHKNLLREIEILNTNLNQTREAGVTANDHMNEASEKPTAKNEWSKDDADELITVILPTINND